MQLRTESLQADVDVTAIFCRKFIFIRIGKFPNPVDK